MKKTETPQRPHDAAEFHRPDLGELGFICASALMPYLLACILLAA